MDTTLNRGPSATEPSSEDWLTELRCRRRAALSHVRGEELGDIAVQAADDALAAVLAKLEDFRGASRFWL